MIREVNAAPFTDRLHYTVEEVSLEEFMSVVAKQKEASGSDSLSAIEKKILQTNS